MSSNQTETMELLLEAVKKGDLTVLKGLVDSHGLAYCSDLLEGYVLLCNAIKYGHFESAKFLIEKGAKLNDQGDSALHLAIEERCLELVESLLEHGAEINCFRLRDHYAPLHVACNKRCSETVSLLLSYGADPNIEADDKTTPLILATREAKLDIIKSLLQRGAQVNCSRLPDKYTPLHIIAHYKGADMIELCDVLLKSGAEVNAEANDGTTPLHIAVQAQCLDMVKTLLKHGAKIDCRRLRDNLSPLHIACSSLFEESFCIVEYLLKHGANPNIKGNNNITPLHMAVNESWTSLFVECLLKHGAEVNAARLSDNYSPLHIACGSTENPSRVVDVLLNHGANPNAKANDNVVPLHLATENKWLEVVESLLKHGANVNDSKRSNDFTPLFIACEKKMVEIVDVLLQNGADPNIRSNFNDVTPLHLAIEGGSVEIMEFLVQYGASLRSEAFYGPKVLRCPKEKERFSPLFFACRRGNSSVVDFLLKHHADASTIALEDLVRWNDLNVVKSLLDHGADVNCSTSPGTYSPLQVACVKDGFEEMVDLLLDQGADPNVKDYYNVTPLLSAVDGRKLKYVESLLKHGAEVNCSRLSDNYTPLHIACAKNLTEIISVLLNNGADPNTKAFHDLTPLHLAFLSCSATMLSESCHKHIEIINALLNNGADPNAKAKDNRTPLHLACLKSSVGIIKSLLRYGAEVNCPRLLDHYTPLHLVCDGNAENALEKVLLLLESGAHVNALAKNNITPLQLAVMNYSLPDKLIEELLKNLADINLETSYGSLPFQKATGWWYLRSVEAPCKHAIKLKVAGFYVSEKNLHLVELDDPELHSFQEECEKELRLMKAEKLSSFFTLYDLLQNQWNPVDARDESLIKNLASFNYEKFPIYSNFLEKNKQRTELLISGQKWLAVLLKTSNVLNGNRFPNLFVELLGKIVSYLSKEDIDSLKVFGEDLKRQLTTNK